MSNLTTIINNVITKTNTNTKYRPIAKSSLLNGTFSVSNTVSTPGFGTKLYTGNGSTQSINAGIDLATQWGDDASETYGGLVWIKNRSAIVNNTLTDSINGAGTRLLSDATNALITDTYSVSSFNNNGFSLNTSSSASNGSGVAYASWIFQTTHRITGTTNHGKAYTCHYNPITGFTIVKYEGSGIAGHEIPHHLGRELGFAVTKNLSAVSNWSVQNGSIRLALNVTNAQATNLLHTFMADNISLVDGDIDWNTSGQSYILYGWANSYYNNGELNGNYEIGIYQGTGASGNKITTRGKPAWIMSKRLDASESWGVVDNQRGDYYLIPNSSNAEASQDDFDFVSDGFICKHIGNWNTSGGQYLYMVAYDNDSGSGLSKYPKASETSNLQVANGLLAYSNGFDTSGAVSSVESLGSTTIIPTGGFDI